MAQTVWPKYGPTDLNLNCHTEIVHKDVFMMSASS